MGAASTPIASEIAAGGALSAMLLTYPKFSSQLYTAQLSGWGCTQLSAFDLVYAHGSSAFFYTPFANLGILPEGGSSYNFPKSMGKAHANALRLAGDRLSAHEAWVGGLVTSVVEAETREAFLAEVLEKAKKLVTETLGDVEVKREAGFREGRDLIIMFERGYEAAVGWLRRRKSEHLNPSFLPVSRI